MSPQDVDDAIEAACTAVASEAGARWIRTVLRNQALREARGGAAGRGGPVLLGYPPALADVWAKVAERVDKSGLLPHRVIRMSMEQALAACEADGVRRKRAEEKRLLTLRKKWLNSPRTDTPAGTSLVELSFRSNRVADGGWQVEHHNQDIFTVGFHVGTPHRFHVEFHRRGDVWSRGWGTNDEIVPGSGLFPRIDGVLGDLTSMFLHYVRPDALRIDGADAKRNRHNAATYGRLTPPDYALGRIVTLGPEGYRADENGCIAVAFVSRFALRRTFSNLEGWNERLDVDLDPGFEPEEATDVPSGPA